MVHISLSPSLSAFSSGESLTAQGLIWQSPSQIIRAQTEGGVQAFNPASRDLGKVVSRERWGGRGWMPGEDRFIDRWYMWNKDQKEGFWPSGSFQSGVQLSGSVSQLVCVFVIFAFISPSNSWSLWSLPLSTLFHLSYCPFIFTPIFFLCECRLKVCSGFVHWHKISFTRFCWRLTLNCQQLLFHSSNKHSQ